jgi:hypothetical protein
MADDTLRDFAHTLAAKVALAKADAETDEDALYAIGELLHEAKRDPAGWLEANRYRGRTQAVQPERAMPDPVEVYAARATQVARKG